MRAVIDDKDIKIIPKRFEKVYFHWIDNLRDWCVSRQIWWGHQAPVWYKGDEIYVGVQAPKGQGWQRDPDTLDTWFSSALWTWSTLIDPKLAGDYSLSLEDLLKQSTDYQTYHPTSVMETVWDILFFWVARMILATTYTTGEIPFKKVYLHGLVRTESGKKMSKSDPEGNIDPMELIGEFGADALRLSLVAGTSPGNDTRLGKSKVIANRNFCNKLWNIARYIEANATKGLNEEPAPETAADHWILNELSISVKDIGSDLENFRFGEAYDKLYHFVWDDLADWYIEASKTALSPGVLAQVLKNTLLLAHPFAPFITEAIWQELNWQPNTLLASMEFPKLKSADLHRAQEFDGLKLIVTEARRVRTVAGLHRPSLLFEDEDLIKNNSALIARLAGLAEVRPISGQGRGIKLVMSGYDCWLDADASQKQGYRQSLKDVLNEQKKSLERLKMRLDNKEYVASAPNELVAQTKDELSRTAEQVQKIEQELSGL